MRVLLLSLVTLAGCANPSYHQDRAANATPVQLCEAFFYGPGPVQRAAAYEREYRNLDCNQYRNEAALMYQQRGQRGIAADAAVNNLSRQLLTPAAPPPRPINCQSYRVGNTLETQCF